jgi:hypothetical protein
VETLSQHSIDLTVFLIVVGLRLIVPLFIPRFPLPAIVAAMIIDAADQTVFQKFTHLNLDGYQSYDKALDIYYLTIAFLATFRNWTNLTAFRTSRFLYFYRMVGVILFEFTGLRWILLVFPNTFEYFFDFYEGVRLRWNPLRMTKRLVIGAAAFIWIVIKLPQEYWIHVAQLDTTDLIRKYPGWTVAIIILAIIVAILLWKLVWPKLPPKEWDLSFDADSHAEISEQRVATERITAAERFWDSALVEKVAFISMVSIIFGKILPSTDIGPWQLAFGIAVVVIANTFVSHYLVRRGAEWETIAKEFGAMLVINFGIAMLGRVLLPGDNRLHTGALLFFLFLLTLMVTLYDRYRPRYLARFDVNPAF